MQRVENDYSVPEAIHFLLSSNPVGSIIGGSIGFLLSLNLIVSLQLGPEVAQGAVVFVADSAFIGACLGAGFSKLGKHCGLFGNSNLLKTENNIQDELEIPHKIK